MGFEPITNRTTICYSTIKLYLSKFIKNNNFIINIQKINKNLLYIIYGILIFYFIPTPRSRRITLLRLHPSYKL